jgi:hypothetical protein
VHCSLVTSASAGNGTSIPAALNLVHTLLCRCQWSFRPAKPSGAVALPIEYYHSPTTRDVGLVPS